jgi:VWFA-related protein
VLTPTRSRRVRDLGVALFLVLSAAFIAAGPQQQPPFKAGTNFVRVDVYPTRDGVPVDDLSVKDFQIAEDGVAQKIESFEHVSITPAMAGERVDPSSPSRAAELVADPHRRVFVIFLDTGNVHVDSAGNIREPLITLLTNMLGPDDLVGLMEPSMSPDAIAFGRKTEVIENGLRTNWPWGRRDTLKLDPQEQLYASCWPPTMSDPEGPDGLTNRARQVITRYRERVAFDALRDLVHHMGAMREGRTAVITVSEGWVLYKPNEQLTHIRRNPITGAAEDPIPGTPRPVGVGPGGTLVTNPQPYDDQSQERCDKEQMELAMADNERIIRDIFEDANRANVSFYPIDPRGLPAADADIGPNPPPPPSVDHAVLVQRIDTLRMLAENTDGVAFVNNNDLTGQMRRLAADLTSYYLLGYSSTNARLDGGFRKIKVRVTRPGIEVRARHGYRAASAAEIAAAKKAADAPKPVANAALNAELNELARAGREERPATARNVAGEPAFFRRGPATGNALQRTTAREFSRTERLHIEMLPGEATAWTGALLDRTGKRLPIPVTTGDRTDPSTGQRWLTADLMLAPLGAGDYAIELTVQRAGEPVKILKAIHVTP